MQIQGHSEIQPTFSRPHVADVARPFPVGPVRCKVPVQQIRRDVEGVVAICGHLVFLRPFDPYAVLAHQPTNAAMADVQTELLQLFGHSWAAVAAKA